MILPASYSDPADLIYDGQNLGFLLDERGQGSPDFLERFAAALAEQQGYQVTDDEGYYIRKRDSPVLEQQQGGMTIQ